jgi:hypothetical protein
MSQTVISQKIKRTCDGCQKEFEYELIGQRPDTEIEELFNWVTLIRELPDQETGRMAKIMVQAHSLECIPAAGCKLYAVAQQNEPNIDISALQVNKPNQQN